MSQGECGHGERLERSCALCPHQQLAAIEALDPDACKWSQGKRNNLTREAYDAKQQRRMGQSIDQPAGRQTRHPCADHGDALAEEKEFEVAVSQRSPGVRYR